MAKKAYKTKKIMTFYSGSVEETDFEVNSWLENREIENINSNGNCQFEVLEIKTCYSQFNFYTVTILYTCLTEYEIDDQ